MDEFHLLRPWWLFALPVGAALIWGFVRRLQSGERWRDACDPALLPHLLVDRPGARRPWLPCLLAAAMLLAVLALSGPTWHSVEQPVYRSRDARIVVLDLSRSMDAPDLKPSRLVRARFKAADIFERTREGQAGLVVYAGDAFVVSPLTDDANTLIAMLPALSTGIVPVQGSRGDLGLRRAHALLEQAGAATGEVVLISDAVDDFRAVQAAADLRESGFWVSTLAVGTTEGAPIPLPSGGFLKDDAGVIVIPRLATKGLREVARAGGGRFATLTADDRDVEGLLRPQDARFGIDTEATEREAHAWRDEGPWLVLALLPLAALAFRRGWLLVLVPVLCAPAEPALGFDWDDLWRRADQQVAKALVHGDAEAAVQAAVDQAWLGAALYRNGDFDDATQAYGELDGKTADYNRGNALAKAGRLRAALGAYDEALSLDPEFEDATFNRALVEELLRQQTQERRKAGDTAKGGARRGGDAADGARREESERAGEGDPRGEAQPGENDSSAQDGSSASSASGEAGRGEPPNRPADARDRPAGPDGPNEGQLASLAGALSEEHRQALEQWLRRIPDDPGGLLRQKFILDYNRRGRPDPDTERTW